MGTQRWLLYICYFYLRLLSHSAAIGWVLLSTLCLLLWLNDADVLRYGALQHRRKFFLFFSSYTFSLASDVFALAKCVCVCV